MAKKLLMETKHEWLFSTSLSLSLPIPLSLSLSLSPSLSLSLSLFFAEGGWRKKWGGGGMWQQKNIFLKNKIKKFCLGKGWFRETAGRVSVLVFYLRLVIFWHLCSKNLFLLLFLLLPYLPTVINLSFGKCLRWVADSSSTPSSSSPLSSLFTRLHQRFQTFSISPNGCRPMGLGKLETGGNVLASNFIPGFKFLHVFEKKFLFMFRKLEFPQIEFQNSD